MKTKNDRGVNLGRLLGEILGVSPVKGGAAIRSWSKPGNDLSQMLSRDYVRDLRRHLPYRHLQNLVDAYRQILPDLNRKPIGLLTLKEIGTKAAELRLSLKASPLVEDNGLALRGFYYRREEQRRAKPLVYINTAHPPLIVAATFCHEVGHHVDTRMRGESEPLHMFYDAGYSLHMEDPGELAADVFVSLAGYPERRAREIFACPWNWGLVARAAELSESAMTDVRDHLRKIYDFDVARGFTPVQRVRYLAGMIHYAKLRWALLAEYDL